jgi:sec-independent protein translocase protein TatA
MTNYIYAGILGGLGAPEMILIFGALLLMFGGKKIPELMKGLGQGVKEFKDASKTADHKEDNTPVEKK